MSHEWCGVRNYPLQFHYNKNKGTDGILSDNTVQNFIKTQELRYGWYVIRNFDPINALKLKKVRYGNTKKQGTDGVVSLILSKQKI